MRFKPGLAMTAFVLIFLPLTLTLGLWQLNRAQEKNQLLEMLESRTDSAVENWEQGRPPAVGIPVQACVDWAGDSWYLDNRTIEGRVGYELYLPVTLCRDRSPLLLRLGWIEGERTRSSLPRVEDLAMLRGETRVEGEMRPRVGTPFLTADPEAMGDGRWRIQSLTDVPDERWGADTPVLQLQVPQMPQLRDEWNPVNMPPERHVGYAIQWFGLALVLVVGFLIWGKKRGQQTTERS